MTAQRREERETWYKDNISTWSMEDVRNELAVTQCIAAGKTGTAELKDAYQSFARILAIELSYRQAGVSTGVSPVPYKPAYESSPRYAK